MSYLDCPRLHFAGSFQADPSTVNNDPAHFDGNRFVARFQRRQTATEANGLWNPEGTAAWRLRNCRVRSAVLADGTILTARDADPVVGGLLDPADDRVTAKIVDLDPQQQMVSEIWGLRLGLRDRAGGLAFEGDFESAAFADIWQRCPSRSGDAAFGAMYQSVITGVAWADQPRSSFLDQLAAAADSGPLSIKFNLDGFNSDSTSPSFTWGRIVGSIGPYRQGEPKHFVSARLLRPQSGSGLRLGPAPCRIEETNAVLSLDLGNSLPTIAPGGLLQELGPLHLMLLAPAGPPLGLATLPPASGDLYESHAGVVSVPLSPLQLAAASAARLAIVNQLGTVLLAENEAATFVRADRFVLRISPRPPGNAVEVAFHATRHGRPLAGAELNLPDEASLAAFAGQAPPTDPPTGVPSSALAYRTSVTTDEGGRAELVVTASPPGNPRRFIDGQVYSVPYALDGDPGAAGPPLAVLVWDDYEAPRRPTWVDDVQPVLQQYANLYPAMRHVVDLANYQDVVDHRRGLRRTLTVPVKDADSMPVSRDLSPAKRAMLLSWLDEDVPPLVDITDVYSLRRVLQLAMELEHATVPPYLCALFSIRPGRNAAVAATLRRIVVQEMLHMALLGNLLNAVGGAPLIDKAAFIPRFPGYLPAGVRPDVTVSLRRCSKQQIRDVFMAIEQPERTLERGSTAPPRTDTREVELTPEGSLAGSYEGVVKDVTSSFTDVEYHPLTIGWLYNHIARAVVDLDERSDDLFSGNPSRQLTPGAWPDAPGRLYRITDRASAVLGLKEIVTQGEGASLSDPTESRNQLAHFFRFQEIVEGQELVRNPAGEWVFEGDKIPFDEDGIYPMADDPDAATLPLGSVARIRSQLFNAVYGDLLRALQKAFNGRPSSLNGAVGLMFSLEIEARKLMQTPIAEGSPFTAGPSFQPDLR